MSHLSLSSNGRFFPGLKPILVLDYNVREIFFYGIIRSFGPPQGGILSVSGSISDERWQIKHDEGYAVTC